MDRSKYTHLVWAMTALMLSIGAFSVGYINGVSDATMSATSVTATQLKDLHARLDQQPVEASRRQLLGIADHSLKLNSQNYQLGPLLAGLMLDRDANFELMRRYASYRATTDVAAPDADLQRALRTFAN